MPSGPGLPSPSSSSTSLLFAAGGASSSHIPLLRHCLQLWPGLSHFLPFFCPTPLLCTSDRSQPGLPHRKKEKGSHLFRRLLTYGPTPQGCREEGIMRNSCMHLTPGTGYRASDNRGRNTAKGNPQSLWGPSHCSPLYQSDGLSWLHLLFPSSRYLAATPSPWPDPQTPQGRRQGKSLTSVARCLRSFQEDLWRAALSLYRGQQCAPRKENNAEHTYVFCRHMREGAGKAFESSVLMVTPCPPGMAT